jgi:hypothetical protein
MSVIALITTSTCTPDDAGLSGGPSDAAKTAKWQQTVVVQYVRVTEGSHVLIAGKPEVREGRGVTTLGCHQYPR